MNIFFDNFFLFWKCLTHWVSITGWLSFSTEFSPMILSHEQENWGWRGAKYSPSWQGDLKCYDLVTWPLEGQGWYRSSSCCHGNFYFILSLKVLLIDLVLNEFFFQRYYKRRKCIDYISKKKWQWILILSIFYSMTYPKFCMLSVGLY